MGLRGLAGFGGTNVEITHRKFDECAITWNQVDMSAPIEWYATGIQLDWRADPHAEALGVAMQLSNFLRDVAEDARRRGATRYYWLTKQDNRTARALYDKLADRSGFIQYRKILNQPK